MLIRALRNRNILLLFVPLTRPHREGTLWLSSIKQCQLVGPHSGAFSMPVPALWNSVPSRDWDGYKSVRLFKTGLFSSSTGIKWKDELSCCRNVFFPSVSNVIAYPWILGEYMLWVSVLIILVRHTELLVRYLWLYKTYL